MRCTNCSASVKWIVAVDIDGTLATYHNDYVRFVERYMGLEEWSLPTSWTGLGEFRDCLGLTKEQHHTMKLAFRSGGHKRWMGTWEHAGLMMDRLCSLPDLEVWVTTTRPWMRLDNQDTDTIEWLRRWEIPYDHLLFDEDKYRVLTEIVDSERIVAVLDDEQEQMNRCRELNLPFVLRQTNWNHGIVPHGPSVQNLLEFPPMVRDIMGMRNALHVQG